VQHRIETGQYASVSDYVRDLIRRDQEASERQALVAALIEGEKSGLSKRDIPAILAGVKARAK